MFSPRVWLVFLLSCLLANTAFAARTKAGGLALIMEGTDRETQREVSEFILRDIRSQPSDEFLDALTSEGVTGSVAEALGNPRARKLIGVEGTYGIWNYAFTGIDEAVDEAPSVQYKYARAGADARIPFGAWALLAGAGYMNIASAGTLSERFPRLTVSGVDALGGGTWAVATPIELRLLITYSRFFSSANPEPGAEYIAGGTLDQYVVLTLGASTIF